MVNYPHHTGSKDTTQEDIISYGAAQLLQERPDIRYHSDTTQPPFGSPSTFITDRIIPRHPAPHYSPQYNTQYNPHGYELAPPQNSRKRQHTDNGANSNRDMDMDRDYPPRPPVLQSLPTDTLPPVSESTESTYPVHNDHRVPQSSNHDYGSLVSLPLPQQHHHHRLPSQARTHVNSDGDSGNGSALGAAGDDDMSFMNQEGLPAILPEPKAKKTKFGKVEDDTLIELKEHWKFTWKQIQFWFPGRASGTLQVRYCTKLKVKDLKDIVWTEEMVCFVFII
jgi:hypothetical protein